MNNDKLEPRIKRSLDSKTTQIDAATQQRLNQARRSALNQTDAKSWLSRQWMPVTGVAFCSIFAVMLALNTNQIQPTSIDQTAMIELIENSDDVETLSDPAFDLWLDEIEGSHV